jgi:hypothetical protein
MLEFFQYATSGFWTFVGIIMIISVSFTGLTELITRTIKAFRK